MAAAFGVVVAGGIGSAYLMSLPPSGETILSGGKYGIRDLLALTASGPYIWVVNDKSNSLTELDADGAWVRTLSGKQLGLDSPSMIAAYGDYLWVVSQPQEGNWSLTELDSSTGRELRKLDSFNPGNLTVAGGDLWVTGGPDNADVTELNAANGSMIRTVSSPSLSNASAVATDGPDIWIASEDTSSRLDGAVTELDAATGRVIRTISDEPSAVPDPAAIAADGDHIWIANGEGAGAAACGSVTELDASTGAVIRVLDGATYGFDEPSAITVHGSHVWVVSDYNAMAPCPGGAASSVIELSAVTGTQERALRADCSHWARLDRKLFGQPSSCFQPFGIAIAGQRVWFGTFNNSVVGVRD